jgi:hypothetical protein
MAVSGPMAAAAMVRQLRIRILNPAAVVNTPVAIRAATASLGGLRGKSARYSTLAIWIMSIGSDSLSRVAPLNGA